MKRRIQLGWLVLSALALALLWYVVATRPFNVDLERERPGRVYDFFSYYRPNAEYAFGRLRDGELPLWNPLQGLGEPFLATLQTGVLYPPNWLHTRLPVQPAFLWLAFGHIALAAVFAGGLARSMGAGVVGGIGAGLLYASSLQVWSSVWTPPTLYAAAWAPGVLLAIERAIAKPSPRRAARIALVLGLQILVGWPYAVVMTALAATITGTASLVRSAMIKRAFPLAAVATIAIGVAGGAMLAAPQLLPSLELMRQSTRAPGTLDEQTSGLGGEMHDPGVFLRSFIQRGVSGGVPGLASPLLALLAVAVAGHGRVRATVMLVVAALALAMSFPNHTPLYDWARHLPPVGDFRFPFRWRLISTLAIAVCAGLGITRIEKRGGRNGFVASLALTALAVGVQLWPMALFSMQMANGFPREQPHRSAGLFRDTPVSDAYARQVAVLRRPDNRAYRSYWQLFGTDKLGERDGIRTLQDLEPLSLISTSRLMTFLSKGDAGVDPERSGGVRPTLGAPYWGSAALPDEPSRAPLLDLMSVRFLVLDEPPRWVTKQWRPLTDAGDPPVVYEDPRALPRAWRATRAEAQPADVQAAIARLVDPKFDVRTSVLLDPLPPALALDGAADDAHAETHITLDQPERVAIHTRGAQPAVLVLNDAAYPGWEATLDGVAAPLLVANTAVRAVAVPAGEHVVEMEYEPTALPTGLALCAFSSVALSIGLLLRPIRKVRKRRRLAA